MRQNTAPINPLGRGYYRKWPRRGGFSGGVYLLVPAVSQTTDCASVLENSIARLTSRLNAQRFNYMGRHARILLGANHDSLWGQLTFKCTVALITNLLRDQWPVAYAEGRFGGSTPLRTWIKNFGTKNRLIKNYYHTKGCNVMSVFCCYVLRHVCVFYTVKC